MAEFMGHFGIIHRLSMIYLSHELGKYGISGSQHMYLLTICEKPGATQDQLSDILKINKGTIAKTMQQFEIDGLVRREQCKTDQRTKMIFPTEKALSLYKINVDIDNQCNAVLSSGLSEQEQQLLEQLLKKVVFALKHQNLQ